MIVAIPASSITKLREAPVKQDAKTNVASNDVGVASSYDKPTDYTSEYQDAIKKTKTNLIIYIVGGAFLLGIITYVVIKYKS